MLAGAALALGGLVAVGSAFAFWGSRHFGPLDVHHVMRVVVPALMAMSLGFQLAITGFLSSILDLKRKRD